MIYVALVEAGALVAAVVAFAGLIGRMTRAQARERELLIGQVIHLTGRASTYPPSLVEPEQEEPLRLLRNVDQMAPEDRL